MSKHNQSTKQFHGENMLRLLKNNWLLLVLCCVVGMSIAGIKKLSAPPQYIISGMFQVNNKQPTSIEDSQPNGLFGNNNDKLVDNTPQSLIVMVTANSPYILNRVINDLNLDIDVKPKLFPIFGQYLYFHFNSHVRGELNWKFTALPFFEFKKYAWGGEQISVSKFVVPDYLREKSFLLRVDGENRYKLFYNNKLVVSGISGVLCGNSTLGISLLVDKLYARKSTEFILIRHSTARIYQSLTNNLQVTEINKTLIPTDHSGIINVSLNGEKPALQANIINRQMELLVEKSLLDKTNSLIAMQKFVSGKLNQVESQVLFAQQQVSDYREQSKIIDLTTQAKLLVSDLDDTNRQLAQNYVTKGSLEAVYGYKHPLMQSLQQQSQELEKAKQNILSEVGLLPHQEAKLAELENSLSAQQNLRDTLVKRNQELQILISGQLSNVKILSYASDDGILPLSSNVKLFTLVGGILGLISGIFLILTRWMLRTTTNPFEPERSCNMPVKMVIRNCRVKIKLHKRIIYNREGYRYFSNLLRKSALNHHEIKRMSAEILLNSNEHHVIGLLSLYPKSGAALIAHNLGRELFLAGKKVLIIQAKRLEEHELTLVDIFDDKTGEIIGSKFTPIENFSIFLLNPDFNLDLYNTHLKFIINKHYYNFDYIFVLDDSVVNDPSRLINFNICTCRYFVTTQQISIAKLEKDLDYLSNNKINIHGIFFNYNRHYFIHDLYSK